MSMSSNEPISHETKTCKECGEEYESNIMTIFETTFSLDGGYCLACREKHHTEELNRNEAIRKAMISGTRRKWRETCGIPSKFMDKDFSTFDATLQKKAYRGAVSYAENFPTRDCRGYLSLLLFSENSWGVGKTHLACSVAHRILDRWDGEPPRCPVLFTTEPDVFQNIQATYNYTQEEKIWRPTADQIMLRLTRVPLLILDDVGKQMRADPKFVQRTLFSIVDGRYRHQRPMVLTTNLSLQRLEHYLGGESNDEATMDRLVEMSELKFYQLEGESYRQRKKEI